MANTFSRLCGPFVFIVAACSSDGSGGTVSDGGPTGGGSTKYDAATLPSCDSLCPAVLAAKCTMGPQSQDDCVGGCQTLRTSKCSDKYVAMFECGGAQPVYGCDSAGRTIVVGCESASAALYTCVGAGL